MDVFSVYEGSNSISFKNRMRYGKQGILVLKKIKDEYPDDKYLLSKKSDNGKYVDNNLFETINRFIYEYKHVKNNFL